MGVFPSLLKSNLSIGSKAASDGLIRSKRLKTSRLDWQTGHAIYFRFLVFLLVPFVRASLL